MLKYKKYIILKINFILLFIKMLFHILPNAKKYSERIYAVTHQYHFLIIFKVDVKLNLH